MIYKQRKVPEILVGQQLLLKRLRPNHPNFLKLQKDCYNSQAGFGGERDFDYQMREFKPDYPYAILHDLYLQQDQVYFQIDSLLITPSAIIVFEVKNMAGKLFITQNPTQFIKEELSGNRLVLKSPIEELERKKYFLTRWLKDHEIELPLLDFVVLAYQNELVIENLATDKVVFAYEVPNRLRRLENQQTILSNDEIRQLAHQLKTHHRAFHPYPLHKKYEVSLSDIQSGVFCTSCQHSQMTWLSKTWRCLHCGHRDLKAHFPALQDWYCVFGPHITNNQLRQFLSISSRHTARRLLTTPNTNVTGSGRAAIYHISSKILLMNESLHT
ncbi:hypothetical protein CSV75_08355 [Sporosarcina sp. P18a]|uniref:nuclease-related domain-containing protein n=1 Tax=Sporosarcina sp. P18a TaxID=2048259 RepID=UPI000C1681BE|nr:nuclease-related domain-containing protein [Sporosarcina sp. P18a]PIC79976.1 hypothetical protein CSV75_08355 [Sporosarcina sp. P18a]